MEGVKKEKKLSVDFSSRITERRNPYCIVPLMIQESHAAVRRVDFSRVKKVAGVLGFISAEEAWGVCAPQAEAIRKLFSGCEVSAVRPLVGFVVAENKMSAVQAANTVLVNTLTLPSVSGIVAALRPSAPKVNSQDSISEPKRGIPHHWLGREESSHNVERGIVIEEGTPSKALVSSKDVASAVVYWSAEKRETEETTVFYRRYIETLFDRPVQWIHNQENKTTFLPEVRARAVLGVGEHEFLETLMLDLLIEVGNADVDLTPYKSVLAAATGPYRLENLRITLSACRTHRKVIGPPDEVAVRVSRAATLAIEGAIEKIARRLDQDPAHFRIKSLLSDRTFFLEELHNGRRRSGFDEAARAACHLSEWPQRRSAIEKVSKKSEGIGFGLSAHCEGWVQCEPWIQAVRLAGEPGGRIEAVLEVDHGFRSLTMLLTRLVAMELGCDPEMVNLTFGVPSRRSHFRHERFCLRGVELIRKAAQDYKWRMVSKAAENSSLSAAKKQKQMTSWNDVVSASRLNARMIEVSVRSDQEPPRSPFSSFWRMGWSVAEMNERAGRPCFHTPQGIERYPETSLVIRPALEGPDLNVFRSFGQWKNIGEKWWILKDPHRDALWVWRILGSRAQEPEEVSVAACASALYHATGVFPVRFPEELKGI